MLSLTLMKNISLKKKTVKTDNNSKTPEMKQLKKKILFINHTKSYGGAFISLFNLLQELRKDFEITVLSLHENSQSNEVLKESGFDVVIPNSKYYKHIYKIFVHSKANTRNWYSHLMKIMSYFFSLMNMKYFAEKELERFEVDLVYLNSTFLSDWAVAAKHLGFKVLVHVREPLAEGTFGVIIRRRLKKSADKIIAISNDNAKRINLMYKTDVIYNPIKIYNPNTHNKIKLREDKVYFLYLGGDSLIKGFYLLAKSLKHLNPNIIILIGGRLKQKEYNSIKGKLKNTMRKCLHIDRNFSLAYEKLNEATNYIALNSLKPEDVFYYLSNCRALISPFSTPHFARPVIESYVVGLPVIVSDVEGMLEIFSDKTGLMFHGGHKELAKSINLMSEISDTQIKTYKINCKKYYDDLYRNNPNLNNVIKNLID